MKANKGIIFLAILISLVLSKEIFARTRDEVINEATAYKNYSWSCGENNILDIYDHINSTTSKAKPGQDGYDDRAFKWDIKKSSWIYSTQNWPFYVSTITFTGEAYAYGRDNTKTNFENKIKGLSPYTGQKWIAGRRDTDPQSVTGYNGFTGIDCAEFVEEMWIPGNTNDIYSGTI